MKFKQHTHPFRVSLCQIVINSYNMNTFTSKCIKIQRQGCNKSFTLTCCHFSNLSLVQNSSTNKLDIIMYHIPLNHIASCHPSIIVISLITNNIHIIFYCRKVFIVITCCNLYLIIFSKTFGRFFNDCKSIWKNFIQNLLSFIVDFLF